MNRSLTFFLASFFLISSAGAAAIPAAAGLSSLSAGEYTATVSPTPDQETADEIKESLQEVPGVGSAVIFGDSPALEFTIEKGRDVDLGDLQQELTEVSNGLIMTTPQLTIR